MPNERHILAPYVATPYEVVDRMLELAEVTAEDVVYDLGCGDGRIVIEAARRYGTRGVGVDVEPYWIEQARGNALAAGVEALVRFERADALAVDLGPATVITLYLVPWSMQMAGELLAERAQAGTRVVSHNFEVEGWAPARTASMTDEEGDRSQSLPVGHRLPIDRLESGVPFVYMLRCSDGSLYTGIAKDLKRRIAQHQAGRASRYTRSRLPVALAWSREIEGWGDALREEIRIKGLSRTEKEALVEQP